MSGTQLIIIQALAFFLLLLVNIAILNYHLTQKLYEIIENQETIIQLLNSTGLI